MKRLYIITIRTSTGIKTGEWQTTDTFNAQTFAHSNGVQTMSKMLGQKVYLYSKPYEGPEMKEIQQQMITV